MVNHAAVLHALVVPAADDLPFMHEHGADGNAARSQPFARFLDGRLQEWIALRHGPGR